MAIDQAPQKISVPERYEDDQTLEETSVAELWAEIDREARRRLGLSGEEFARLYHQKALPDTLAAVELAIVLSTIDDVIIRT
jgi:ribosome-binding protein aMBF1 (putative translation factor)